MDGIDRSPGLGNYIRSVGISLSRHCITLTCAHRLCPSRFETTYGVLFTRIGPENS